MGIESIVRRNIGSEMKFLIKSSFWLNLEKGWRMVSELGILVLLTRLTDLKVVGQYELLTSVYSLMAILAITGFNSSLLRALATGYDGTLREIMRLSWRWSGVGTAVLIVAGWWCWQFGNREIGWGLLMTAPVFPWYTVLRRWDVILQAKERFAERSAYYAISSMGLLAAVGAAIWWYRDSIVIPFTVLVVVQTIFNIIFFNRAKRLVVGREIEPGWMKSGYKLFVSELFNVMYSKLDRLVLAGWLGLEALAIYGIATKIGEGLKLVLGGVVSAYVPRLYRNGTAALVSWFRSKGWQLAAAIVIGLAGLWVITPGLIVLLFGNAYHESRAYAQWYLLVVPFHLLASIWGYLLIKERRELLFVAAGVIAGAVNVSAYVILIPLWGISGAVAGSIAYYAVMAGLYIISVKWMMKMNKEERIKK